MSEKIWLKHYPHGMPVEIDPDRFGSLVELLEYIVGKYADKPAYHNLGYSMSYAELARKSRDFAAYLQCLQGMAKGERVAIMSPNLLQYPVALFGILRAGMTVVNVNPLYTPRELEHQLKDSGAKAIVILENFASTLQQVISEYFGAARGYVAGRRSAAGAEAVDRQYRRQTREAHGPRMANRWCDSIPRRARSRCTGDAQSGEVDAR